MKKHNVYFGGVPGMDKAHINYMEEELKRQIPDINYTFFGEDVLTSDGLIERCHDAEVIISWDQEMDEKAYSSLKNLKAYCAASIGYNAANVKLAEKYGVIVTNAGSYCIEEVATHTVALILSCNRKLKLMNESVIEGNWNCGIADPIMRFSEATVGLYGFGNIGRKVAEYLKGFGCRIIATDPFADEQIARKLNVQLVDLETLAKESDYISIHAPLLESTEYVFNRNLFSIMKDSVCIINTSRGKIIKHDDLYEALISGKVSFVGLDVLEKEPPGEIERKIINHPHAIVTPHAAYCSTTASRDQILNTVQCVKKILNNELPDYIVNPGVINKINWLKK